MRTEWRDGGPPPQITFRELCWLTDTQWMKKPQVAEMWTALLDIVQAWSRHSVKEGGLPAYESFVEELCVVLDAAISLDVIVPWSELPVLAIRSAIPANWELVPCGRL